MAMLVRAELVHYQVQVLMTRMFLILNLNPLVIVIEGSDKLKPLFSPY